MPGPGSELIGAEEVKQAIEVLEAGHLFRYGEESDPSFKGKVRALEDSVAKLSGTKYGLAVNSGTSALLCALLGLGVGPGDEVIVPGYTFVASMSTVVFSRAVPVLAEVDETLNLDPADVKARITPRTKAIMAVHMLGNPAQIDELKKIAKEHGVFLIEDCAQAFGATFHRQPVGSFGDVGAFSFNVFKTITAGDGGMVVTDDENSYRRYFAIHDQGHSPLRSGAEIGKRPLLGLDFRMTELTAAVLLAQLGRLEFIKQRLARNKRLFKSIIAAAPGIAFRRITDEEGDLGTILTVLFPSEEIARLVAKDLGTKLVVDSGWHVYSNMEHLLNRRTVTARGCPFDCASYPTSYTYSKGMLPKTDGLLSRAMNISIGIPDPGLGAGWGVNIKDDEQVVRDQADLFCTVVSKYLR